ncbi:PDDEXK family nuclease [Salinigranum halophilum]|uniref:hypothetical protein n=1 Tax=Salinigranum halophilum TaxID=2565931 RepID=UPI0010A76A33|nr:hypothetical protein [Salinigranum halophilum]
MRFSHVAIVYFMMGVVVVGAGVVPASQIGIADVFVDTDGQDVQVNSTAVGGAEGTDGMLDNLIGPVRSALNTISGGALMAVWGPLSTLMGFIAWPVTTMSHLGAPFIVQALASVFVAAFSFGVLRVFRASI